MKVKKIKPMYTKIVTTADKYIEDNSGALITDVSKLKQGITEYQKVLSIGNSVRNVKVGELVCINPDRYKVMRYKQDSIKSDLMTNQVDTFNFPMVNLDGKDCLLLDEADIEFVIEEWED